MDNNVDFKNKYLKYKIKYLELKAQAKKSKEDTINEYRRTYNGTEEELKQLKKKVGIYPIILSYLDTGIPKFELLEKFLYERRGSRTYSISLSLSGQKKNNLYNLLHILRRIYLNPNEDREFFITNSKGYTMKPDEFFKIFKNSLPEGEAYYSKRENYESTQKILETLLSRAEDIAFLPYGYWTYFRKTKEIRE